MNDVTIAIDLPRLRIYARGDAQAVYQWLSRRFDGFDLITYPNPVLLLTEELTADGGWTLDWKPA